MNSDLESGLIPAFVVVTLGTTGLCAFDDLDGVAKAVRHRSKTVSGHFQTQRF